MSTTNDRAAAIERLSWKRSGTNAVLSNVISKDEEVDEARRALDSYMPLLVDAERSRRDHDLMRAAEVLAENLNAGKRLDGGLPTGKAEQFKRLLNNAETHDSRVRRFEKIVAEKRATLDVAVTREPRVYGTGSGNSYFLDLARSVQPASADHQGAVERLERYAREVSVESSLRTDEGKRAIRSAETRGRSAGGTNEVRALTTGSNSGGAFTTPLYITQDWSMYRSYGPSFVEQTQKLEDPGYGLALNLPSFTSSVSVAQQTEGATVSNTSPSGSYITSTMVSFAGEVDISQQLYDRAGPENIDSVIYAQLAEELNTSVDTYALTQALSTAGSVSGSSVWSNAAFFGDVAKAGSQMMTSAGTVLPPTHMYVQPVFYRWLLGQTDTSGRPLVVPTPTYEVLPVQNGPEGEVPPGFNGERILDSAVFVDGNLANVGSNSQIVLCNASNVYTLLTEPTTRAVCETLAGNMEVVVQLYAYFGILVRHSAAVQTITGNAYPASPSFL